VTAEQVEARLLYDFNRVEMESYVPHDAKTILDVGCSTGKFGELLEARGGVTVVGVEPDARSAELAEHRITSVVNGLFPDVEAALIRGDGYDAITFNDVLEHMPQPELALAAARRLLASGGVVVASIPNVRHITALGPLLVRGDWRYTDVGILDRTHLRFFTRSSIEAFFGGEGWRIRRIEGINRCRRLEVGDTRSLRIVSRLSGGRTDPFFFLQYAVVAEPM
jgi:2-polyprenyl-3-methyl-5-hydroxy-6-metoxy-1,4-benzoquinol methylase